MQVSNLTENAQLWKSLEVIGEVFKNLQMPSDSSPDLWD